MTAQFWDTNLFIYLIEQNPNWYFKVGALRREILRNREQLVTSSLTLGEVLVRPLQENRLDLAAKYRRILTGPSLALVDFDQDAADRFAQIRAQYGKRIRPPDAIRLACAAAYQVDRFSTNDDRLEGVIVEGVSEIVALKNL